MTAVRIRPLDGRAELDACVRLQHETWGPDFSEVVAASMLEIVRDMGGVVSGAFDGDRLVGFVFGITGLRDGRLAHWSDMLAVHPEYRGRGIGRRLKLHQRDLLLERGVDRVFWTFDPLVARNAHLNLRRLGAIARTYRRDVYGGSNSPLHAGFGTDRLIAEWHIDSARVRRRLSDPGADAVPDAAAAPLLDPVRVTPRGLEPDRDLAAAATLPDTVRVAVPVDIMAMKRQDLELAREWRAVVRRVMERAMADGYVAVDLLREDGVCSYVLRRGFTL